MTGEAEIHQLGDASHVRDEKRRGGGQDVAFVGVRMAVQYIGATATTAHASVVLTANERPAVHLEVRQIGGWQYAAHFQQFRRFQLHHPPLGKMSLIHNAIRWIDPLCVHAGHAAQLLAVWNTKRTFNFDFAKISKASLGLIADLQLLSILSKSQLFYNTHCVDAYLDCVLNFMKSIFFVEQMHIRMPWH